MTHPLESLRLEWLARTARRNLTTYVATASPRDAAMTLLRYGATRKFLDSKNNFDYFLVIDSMSDIDYRSMWEYFYEDAHTLRPLLSRRPMSGIDFEDPLTVASAATMAFLEVAGARLPLSRVETAECIVELARAARPELGALTSEMKRKLYGERLAEGLPAQPSEPRNEREAILLLHDVWPDHPLSCGKWFNLLVENEIGVR